MPRLHFVKKARKADKAAGIKKGDSYYWWQFRHGPKHKSKTKPARSQLTQSEFYAFVYDLEDELAEVVALRDAQQIASTAADLIERVSSMKDELEEKLSNVEEAFPNGCPSAELLQERIDACDDAEQQLQAIEDAANDYEEPEAKDDGEDEDEDAALEAVISEAEGFTFNT